MREEVSDPPSAFRPPEILPQGVARLCLRVGVLLENVLGPVDDAGEPLHRNFGRVLQYEILDALFSVHEEFLDGVSDRLLRSRGLQVANGERPLAKTFVEACNIRDLSL